MKRVEDRKLYAEDVATKLNIAASTWRRYCSESPGRRRIAPPQDGVDLERGHARPYWLESTIDAFRADRLGRGRRSDLAS